MSRVEMLETNGPWVERVSCAAERTATRTVSLNVQTTRQPLRMVDCGLRMVDGRLDLRLAWSSGSTETAKCGGRRLRDCNSPKEQSSKEQSHPHRPRSGLVQTHVPRSHPQSTTPQSTIPYSIRHPPSPRRRRDRAVQRGELCLDLLAPVFQPRREDERRAEVGQILVGREAGAVGG